MTGVGVNALLLEDLATGLTRRATSVQSDATANTYTFVFASLPDGNYRARLSAASVSDLAGNRLAADYALTFNNTNAVHVAGRHVFHNNSAADGHDPRLNAADNAAIAAGKSGLLPGQAAAFANYTSSSRGINGVMVDLARAGTSFTPAARHFRFDVAAPGSATGWRAAATPSGFSILRGAGVNGTDRVLMAWPDDRMRNLWLRITVLHPTNAANAIDVFYFGNLVGDAGGVGTPRVDARDLALTRAAFGKTTAAALNTYDFNRDGRINAVDVILVRNNQRRTLPLFTAPMTGAPAAAVVVPPSRRSITPPRRDALLREPPRDLLA